MTRIKHELVDDFVNDYGVVELLKEVERQMKFYVEDVEREGIDSSSPMSVAIVIGGMAKILEKWCKENGR